MKKNEQPRATRRFREAIDGPEIRRRYAYEPTEDIASLLAKMNSAKGIKGGGRPKNEKIKN